MTNKIEKEYYQTNWKSFAGRVGLKLTFLMGILFLIEGITRVSLLFLFYPDTPLILICGTLAIVGAFLGLKEHKYGRILCLIAGILAIVGFIIFNVDFPFRFVLTGIAIFLPLSYFLVFINLLSPFIFLIGGILSNISCENFLSNRGKQSIFPIKSNQNKILFCPECGKQLLPDGEFCINCGYQVQPPNQISKRK